jgi:hypothetical protein
MRTLVELLAPEALLRTGCNSPKRAGDHVMIGTHHGPVYEIVHVAGDLAWIRPLVNGEEGLAPVNRLRLV